MVKVLEQESEMSRRHGHQLVMTQLSDCRPKRTVCPSTPRAAFHHRVLQGFAPEDAVDKLSVGVLFFSNF